MNDVIKDLYTLTTIPEASLRALIQKENQCIAHNVFESLMEKKTSATIDIGVGTLYIKIEEEGIKYKFVPSKKLEEEVSFAVRNKRSPLVKEVDEALGSRIENAYKRLL